MGYMVKFGTTVKNGQLHISSLGHVINTTIVVLQTLGERFTLVGLHVDKTSFLMSKLQQVDYLKCVVSITKAMNRI